MSFEVLHLGLAEYNEVRKLQNELIEKYRRGEIPETIIICEHPPTLTIGARTKPQDLGITREAWEISGVSCHDVNRGGEATLHLPGQLVIYPVLSLPKLNLGVKRFVELGLGAIAEALGEFGVEADASLCPPGVYCDNNYSDLTSNKLLNQNSCLADNNLYKLRKLAAVGLKIDRGITNHGFAVNINCELEKFSWFSPCGQKNLSYSSLMNELSIQGKVGVMQIDKKAEEFFDKLTEDFSKEFLRIFEQKFFCQTSTRTLIN